MWFCNTQNYIVIRFQMKSTVESRKPTSILRFVNLHNFTWIEIKRFKGSWKFAFSLIVWGKFVITLLFEFSSTFVQINNVIYSYTMTMITNNDIHFTWKLMQKQTCEKTYIPWCLYCSVRFLLAVVPMCAAAYSALWQPFAEGTYAETSSELWLARIVCIVINTWPRDTLINTPPCVSSCRLTIWIIQL